MRALLILALLPTGTVAQSAPNLTAREIARRSEQAVVLVTALNSTGEPISSGSGFFVSRDGMLVTNYHVIEDADDLRIESEDGRRYEIVNLAGYDRQRDLAVLQVAAGNLTPLPIGRVDDMQTGDPVYVMGNPLGMTGTFSSGIVSAKRTVDDVRLLQITAPISQGSSGGPVLNQRGEVIGIATMFVEAGQTLNLAVSSQYLAPLLTRRTNPRRFSRALLPVPARPEYSQEQVNRRLTESGSSGNRWEEQVGRWLVGQARSVIDLGFSLSHEPHIGALEDSKVAQIPLQLVAGRAYAFIAVCDEDCDDVDVGVQRTISGPLLREDVALDDTPIVQFEPHASGRYYLSVYMANCEASVCYYALAVFVK